MKLSNHMRRPRRSGLMTPRLATRLLAVFLLTSVPAVLASRTGAEVKSSARAFATCIMPDTIPIRLSLTPDAVQGGNGTIQCTVDVDQAPAGGGSVQVTCDHPDVLVSPTGSWPYILQIPGGGTSASFAISSRLQRNNV